MAIDYSKFNDAQLEKIEAGDYSPFSNEELMEIVGEEPGVPQEVPEKSFMEELPRYGAQGLRHVAAGVADIPDILHMPANLYNIAEHYVTGEKPKLRSFGLGEGVAKGIDELTHGYTAPKTENEQLYEAGLRGIASGIGTGGVGTGLKALGALDKFSKVGKVAEKVGKGLQFGTKPTAGNIAAQAGSSMAVHEKLKHGAPDDYLGTLAAGYLGGGAGFQGVRAAKKLGQKTLQTGEFLSKPERMARMKNKFYKVKHEAVEPYLKEGVPINLADVSDRDALKVASNIAETNLASEGTLKDLRKSQDKASLKAMGINPLEEPSSMTLGSQIKEGIKNAKENMREKSHAYEKEFLGEEGVNTSIKMSKSEKFVEDFQKELKGMDPADKARIKNFIKLKNEWLRKAGYEDVSMPGFATTVKPKQAKMTYEKAHDFRGVLGKFGKYNEFKSDKEAQLVKGLRKAMNEDMHDTLEGMAKGRGVAFNNRNKAWVDYFENKEPYLEQLFNAADKGEVNAFNDLVGELKKGGHKLDIIAEALGPKEGAKWTASVIYKMASNKEGAFGSHTLYNHYKSLVPEAKQALLKPLPKELQGTVKNIIEQGKSRQSSYNFINASKTDVQNQTRTFMKELGEATVQLARGKPAQLGGLIGSFGLAWGGAKGVLANQDLIKVLAAADKINKKSQVPFLLDKLKNIPGKPFTNAQINSVKSSYLKALHGKEKGIIKNLKGEHHKATALGTAETLLSEARNPDRKEKSNLPHVNLPRQRVSPDGKMRIPEDMSDEEYYSAIAS